MDEFGEGIIQNSTNPKMRAALEMVQQERLEQMKLEAELEAQRELIEKNSAARDEMFCCSAAFHRCVRREHRPWTLDKGFAETLFMLIDRSGMSEVECYKRANVDRKTFSKIKCNKDYRPSKVTAISFAIALRLDLYETNMLLQTIGMTLSNSIEFDVIIRYHIEHMIYDINEINETLFEFDQVLLGS
jgi:hypothetical protein